jgi:hypothetical protein
VAFDRRGLGILALLADVLFALVLAGGPDSLGAIRLAGVSLSWWYGMLAGPLLAAAVTGAILASTTAA